MTDPVMQKLENFIKVVKVPADMTNLFQLLDLTVSGSAEAFMKWKFTEWYSSSISKQLEEGKAIDDINVNLELSILKFLHAHWIKELYDYMTSENGREIISNGWKAAFITEAIEKGINGLEPLDRFITVDPLIHDEPQISEESFENQENYAYFAARLNYESSYNEDWEFEGESINNIFDIWSDETD